jgi:phosphoglucosamine mutase
MALFGTDGVRGLANGFLTAELAVDLAIAAAHILGELGAFEGHRPRAIVGHDSRASGEFLEAAVVAGLASAGVDVFRVGVLPTPAIAYLVADTGADLGVMISASHNPMPDNGIKFFAKGGGKLDDALELAIENRLGEPWTRPTGKAVGRVINDESASERYLFHLLSSLTSNLVGLKLVVDCANGASSRIAPKAYTRAGADVFAISHEPDGWNINENCGSTHLENLKRKVLEVGADLGIAHDGDADRCLAVDHEGNEVDGDHIMAILAADWQSRGLLTNETVVGTVMSNLGFMKAMENLDINVETTAVGDRYVLEKMLSDDHVLGGEQSGHIIMRHYANTGDGILTALHIMQALKNSEQSLKELASVMEKYPQVLINVTDVAKENLATSEAIAGIISAKNQELQSNGRILVRASGTESLVRVMVEAQSTEIAEEIAEEIAALVRSELSNGPSVT